jgi:hypothetical protein
MQMWLHIQIMSGIHTYRHTYIHIYIHTYIHTYAHKYVLTYIHAYIHTRIHTYIHTHTHTHIHTHTHYSQNLWYYGDLKNVRTAVLQVVTALAGHVPEMGTCNGLSRYQRYMYIQNEVRFIYIYIYIYMYIYL